MLPILTEIPQEAREPTGLTGVYCANDVLCWRRFRCLDRLQLHGQPIRHCGQCFGCRCAGDSDEPELQRWSPRW